jgi:hypothetical protein
MSTILLPYSIAGFTRPAANEDPSLWEPVHAEPTKTTTDAFELLRE